MIENTKGIQVLRCLILLLASMISLSDQNSSTIFSNYQSTLNEANQKQKAVLIEFGFDTCPPCLELEKTIFKNDAHQDFISKNFIVYQVDVRKSDAQFLQRKFRVNGYPTTIFINSKDFVLDKKTGFSIAENYLNRCVEVLEKDQAGVCFSNHSAAIPENKRSKFNPNKKSQKQLEAYLTKTGVHLSDPLSWELIFIYLKPPNSFIDAVLHKADTLKLLYPKEEVEDFMDRIFWKQAEAMVDQYPKDYTKQITEYILQFNLKHENTLTRKALWDVHFYAKNVNQLFLLTKEMARLNELGQGTMLSVGMLALEHTSDKVLLEKVFREMKPLAQNSTNFYLTKTVALLAFELNKHAEAKKYAQNSLTLCKQQNGSCVTIENLLAKLKKLDTE